MKISNLILEKYDFDILEIIDSEDENPLNWSLLPIDEKAIPNDGHFLVRSQRFSANAEDTCWINISMPEMIADFVFAIDPKNSEIVLNDYAELADKVVMNKLSNTFACYDLYYTKANPQIGIDVLTTEIKNVTEKGYICEYLGYIYRDEKEHHKSIEWFLKCLEFGEPSSECIYKEISDLYSEIGNLELAEKYRLKLK